jgi:hypothetical protein
MGIWVTDQVAGFRGGMGDLSMKISNLIDLIKKLELEALKQDVESINEYLATISQELGRK